jgi:hypothetical protein
MLDESRRRPVDFPSRYPLFGSIRTAAVVAAVVKEVLNNSS